MLNLLSILQINSISNKTFLSFTFIFRKQVYFIPFGLKILGHENHDNNLESYSMSRIELNYEPIIFIIGTTGSGDI
jgi:hypothetical protein